MNPQLKNWQNFCEFHHGNWHGIWTRYSPSGDAIDSFHCIRSLLVKESGNIIEHQNYYTYKDGTKATKIFGPYFKPNTKSLFLLNSFSLGSETIESAANFGFETGFRHRNKRASLGVLYDENKKLERITAIVENSEPQVEKSPSLPPERELCRDWKGEARQIASDCVVSSAISTKWSPLEELDKNNFVWNLNDGISASLPRQIEPDREFYFGMDWLVDSQNLYRGTRFFDRSGFAHFALEVFANE